MTVIDMVRMLSGSEFNDVSDEDINNWDKFVSPMVSKRVLGSLYNQAKALLICHKMTLSGIGDNGMGELGKVKNSYTASSVSDGGTSISFANGGAGNTSMNAEFAMTVYGTQYLQLIRSCVVPIHVSGEECCDVQP
jgi:hypothetical protein